MWKCFCWIILLRWFRAALLPVQTFTVWVTQHLPFQATIRNCPAEICYFYILHFCISGYSLLLMNYESMCFYQPQWAVIVRMRATIPLFISMMARRMSYSTSRHINQETNEILWQSNFIFYSFSGRRCVYKSVTSICVVQIYNQNLF